MASIYVERLIKRVIELSQSSDWDILKMFNKRDKSSITLGQQKKIRAIIVASIRPYLRNQLARKING